VVVDVVLLIAARCRCITRQTAQRRIDGYGDVLLIVASAFDREAPLLARRWSAAEATVLRGADLSASGWQLHLERDRPDLLCVGGRTIASSDVRGVLTLLPAIVPQELVQIVPADRKYVAGEMTAFLRYWLSTLPCPVLNPPTTTSLSGPAWRPEQWLHLAARIGVPVRPLRRRVHPGRSAVDAAADSGDEEPAQTAAASVIVVGRRYFGSADPALGSYALALAQASGVRLLAAQFDGDGATAHLTGATPWPSLADVQVADAVFDLLTAPVDGPQPRG
jgi:hypothetical protein